jgi:inward rectifier potassium channel
MSTNGPSSLRAPKSPVSLASDPRANMPTIVAKGRRLAPHEDFYHWVLARTWLQFFGAVTFAFAALNVLFAALYTFSPGCIANASSFADHFFFSVQTLGTIGYGSMAPATRYGNVIVSIEALVGLLTSALITGLTFARFAKPTARILFSDKAVIGPRDGVPHLMFRLANWRRNQVVEAQLHVMVLLTETTREGETMRRPTALPLVRDKNPMFALTWTAMHRIDETSPFYGEDAFDRLRAQRAELFLSVSGLDETIMQQISARYRYQLDDIVRDARFADVLVTLDDGTRVIDYDKFHDIVRIARS